MTRNDMIRMAQEAGWQYADDDDGYNPLWRFAAMAFQAGAAAEREACADICDQHASIEGIAQRCAEQIRGRKRT